MSLLCKILGHKPAKFPFSENLMEIRDRPGNTIAVIEACQRCHTLYFEYVPVQTKKKKILDIIF